MTRELLEGSSMPSSSLARRVLAAAIVLGTAAEILFARSGLGVNVLLASAALLGAAALVRRRGTPFDRLDWWLPPATLGFAALVAVRADPLLVLADAAIAVTLLGASLAALSGVPFTRGTFLGAVKVGARLAFAAPTGAATVVREARLEPRGGVIPAGAATRLGPVARGLLLGLPLFVLFATLFASADAVFGRWVESVVSIRIDLGELPGRVLFAAAAAWLAGGTLWAVAHELPAIVTARYAARSLGAAWSLGAASAVSSPIGLRLPSTEVVTVLVGLNVLFAVFVGLQLTYLFGGFDTLAASGLTYAEYARRGFLELVVAASIVGLLVIGLEATVDRRSRPYVAAAVGLMVLTAVVLASALFRLRLYQDAYGWTEFRFYALALIAFLGGALAWAIGLVLAGRSRWLPHALVATGLAVSVAVNLVGPQSFVTARNLERAIDPSLVPPGGEVALDAAYLAGLGEGAIPVIIDALPKLPRADRLALLDALEDEHSRLVDDATLAGWPAWNLDRERAKAALERMSDR